MRRTIWQDLLAWKSKENHKPLIIRGVRQCGKTWILKEFAVHCYEDYIYLNFEGNAQLNAVFLPDLDPVRIVHELELLSNRRIDVGKTLIIFDEIQFCNEALTSLKYFNENMPEAHIIAAGSLLGLALSKPLSFPVGKVDFLDLYPMTFFEFILACGEELIYESLQQLQTADDLPASIHLKLKNLLQEYFFTGGMPEAVASWVKNREPVEVAMIQRSILDSYELDFAKHAPDRDFEKLSSIWHAVPAQLAQQNQKFIFSRVREGYRGRDLESSLQWLISAGLVYKVSKISKPSIPLSAYSDDSFFKLYLCDIGLLRAMADIPIMSIKQQDSLFAEFKGAITENFILNELTASGLHPYFWKSKQTAEVDFVCRVGTNIIPIEVKAEENVRSRSLSVYTEKYKPAITIRMSMKKPGKEPPMYSIPLYLAGKLQNWFK